MAVENYEVEVGFGEILGRCQRPWFPLFAKCAKNGAPSALVVSAFKRA